MTCGPQLGAQLDPAVKAWLDNVIVPAMVRLFVVQHPNFGARAVETMIGQA